MFNLSATGARWKPFSATQHATTARPGFVWDARLALLPGMLVRVVDAYIAGEGLLRPAFLGLFGLGTLAGRGEIARSELLRYFAESLWFPTALLPSQGVVWQAVDDSSATATLADGPLSVTMRVHFDADGLISAIRVDGRAAKVGDATVMMPWEGPMSAYQTRDGMHVPIRGKALYVAGLGERPYFKGTITGVTFRFAS